MLRVVKLPIPVTVEPVMGLTVVRTLEGTLTAEPGSWMVTGIRGERYPIADDILRASYRLEGGGDIPPHPLTAGK